MIIKRIKGPETPTDNTNGHKGNYLHKSRTSNLNYKI